MESSTSNVRASTRGFKSARASVPELLGQTVVVIGGSAGIGLETARRARAEGASVILTARNPEPLKRAASELGALNTAAFDANDPRSLEAFFRDLPTPIDHVMVSGPGPHYWPLREIEFEQARLALSEHLLLAFWVARNAAPKVRPGGTLLFMGGTGGRRVGRGLGLVSAVTAAMPALTASLALESISSPPASSTHRCRRRFSAMHSTPGAISSAPRFRFSASSDRPTLPRSRYIS
jgi:NAD(P)-dependent dehydrogenase (short-subunit alcohol dehydrogenase family)